MLSFTDPPPRTNQEVSCDRLLSLATLRNRFTKRPTCSQLPAAYCNGYFSPGDKQRRPRLCEWRGRCVRSSTVCSRGTDTTAKGGALTVASRRHFRNPSTVAAQMVKEVTTTIEFMILTINLTISEHHSKPGCHPVITNVRFLLTFTPGCRSPNLSNLWTRRSPTALQHKKLSNVRPVNTVCLI